MMMGSFMRCFKNIVEGMVGKAGKGRVGKEGKGKERVGKEGKGKEIRGGIKGK